MILFKIVSNEASIFDTIGILLDIVIQTLVSISSSR